MGVFRQSHRNAALREQSKHTAYYLFKHYHQMVDPMHDVRAGKRRMRAAVMWLFGRSYHSSLICLATPSGGGAIIPLSFACDPNAVTHRWSNRYIVCAEKTGECCSDGLFGLCLDSSHIFSVRSCGRTHLNADAANSASQSASCARLSCARIASFTILAAASTGMV